MTELSEQTRELLAEWVEIKDRLGADSFDGIEPSYRDRLDLVANRTRLLLAEGQAPSYDGGKSVRVALSEAIEFAEQDWQALTPEGEAMLERWRAALNFTARLFEGEGNAF